MSPTALLQTISPAVEKVRRELSVSLMRADLTGYDAIPPMSLTAEIAEIWRVIKDDEEQDFVSFVGSLLVGTGWSVNEEMTAYIGGPGELQARIFLLRNS